MNIVKKIIRKFGFDIVRFSDRDNSSKVVSGNKSNTILNEVIPIGLAKEALGSVGRDSKLTAFTYYQRPNCSSDKMEETEKIWWNKNGRIIEKVWVLSEKTNKLYRSDYVQKASLFFKAGQKKAKVLDLGCGSGWFGRMIADENLEYYGMDFSSTQIEIANSEKEKSKNKEHLNYYCLSDIKKIDNLSEITGVVIHAFLHHLYWEDLNELFKELQNSLSEGCKFFIVEPVYPNPSVQKNKNDSNFNVSEGLIRSYREYFKKVKEELIKKNFYDVNTDVELISIINESIRNGFFLSPKEVPFRLDEFKSFLNKYLEIENMFHCGVLNLETAQLVDRILPKMEKEYYSELLFPIANSIDQYLLSNKYFEENENNYLFTAFECTLKKTVNEIN